MQTIIKQDNLYILRFKKGEEFISTFEDFCQQEDLAGGFFSGIGAALEVEIGYYDLQKHEYYFNTYDETPLEVTNIKGNISFTPEGELTIHAHGTIADDEQQVKGGHFNKLVVCPTLEVAVFPTADKIHRTYDKETELNLLTS